MSYKQHQQEAKPIVARCAIMTLSDTRSTENDLSGQLIVRLLQEAGHHIAASFLLREEPAEIRTQLNDLLSREDVNAIITNGGTGISRRDQTINTIEQFIDVPLPGFGELFRMLSWNQIGSGAMLSRAAGGLARGKLLFALPGSRGAVELAMTQLIIPEVGHLLHELHKTP